MRGEALKTINDMAKKSSLQEIPSVDTETYRRGSGDLFSGFLIALLAALLQVIGAKLPLPALTGLSSTFLFSAAILCSFRTRLLAPLFYAAVLLVIPGEFLTVLRQVCFSLVLALLSRSSRAIFLSPIVIGMWSVVLILNGLVLAVSGGSLFSSSAVIAPFVLELLGVLVMQIALLHPTFTQIFVIPPRQLSLHQLVLLMVQLGAMIAAVVIGGALSLLHPTLLSTVDRELYSFPVLFGLISLFVLPSLASLTGGQFLTRALKLIEEGATEPPAPRHFLRSPVVTEFHRVQKAILWQFQELAEEREQLLKRVESSEAEGERTSRRTPTEDRENANLLALCNAAPLGCLAVGTSGFIIAATKRCSDLLGITNEKLTGRSMTSLGKMHIWTQELAQHLARVTKDARTLCGAPPQRVLSSTQNGEYLEFTVSVVPFGEGELQEYAVPEYTAPSQQMILVYIRKVTDHRALNLSFFAPSPLEIEGVNAQELLRELRDDLMLLHRKSSAARRILESPAARQFNTVALLTELEHFSNITTKDIDLTLVENETAGLRQLDLESLLTIGGELLSDTTARPPLPLIPEDRSKQHLITAEIKELTRFTTLFLGVVYSAGLRGSTPTCSLGHEEIGVDTAKLLPGANPGNYLRLILTLEGLRIGSSVLAEDFRAIPSSDSAQLEQAIIALSIQVRRLGGFLSLQYRGAKDTLLTIYLPQLKTRTDAPPRTRKSRFLRDTVASSLPCAVAVCSEGDLAYDVETPLVTLGFAPQVERKSLLGRGSELVDFMGSGFSEGEERTSSVLTYFPSTEIQHVITQCDAKVLVLSVNEDPALVLPFLEKLENTHPDLGIVLVVDEEREAFFDQWVRVIRPFDSSVLQEAVEASRHLSEHAEQDS